MKHKIAITTIFGLAMVFMGAGFAQGDATSTANVNLSATISSSATLTLNTTTVTFSGGELPPTAMAAAENGSTVNAKFRTASTAPATLKVLATDLTDGNSDVIPVTAIKSTATGDPFFSSGPVTWSKTATGATVGSGQSGNYNGAFNWTLDNSWGYATGTYTGTAVYTLDAP